MKKIRERMFNDFCRAYALYMKTKDERYLKEFADVVKCYVRYVDRYAGFGETLKKWQEEYKLKKKEGYV